MDGNKDAAEHCIELAEKAFNSGDRANAERLLKKSERLFPTQKAKGLSQTSIEYCNNIEWG